MIIKTLYSGLLLPQKILNEVSKHSRTKRFGKQNWFFLGFEEVEGILQRTEPFIRLQGKYIMSQIEMLGLSHRIEALLNELEKTHRPTAVKVLEGVYVHPEALGKVLIKLLRSS